MYYYNIINAMDHFKKLAGNETSVILSQKKKSGLESVQYPVPVPDFWNRNPDPSTLPIHCLYIPAQLYQTELVGAEVRVWGQSGVDFIC